MEQEYLTFILSGEEFGVDILCVQEIRVLTTVTELPNKPDYLKGVINLRGVIIPIVDLRQRFGKDPLDYNDKTVTIILRSQNSVKPMVVGIIVDAVSEVYKFETANIRQPPALGNQIDSCFLKGIAAVEEKLIILLDTNTLLDQDELFSLEAENEEAELIG
ncbi:purine-binding chemotaxis protein CheW [Thalassotalea sp. M1531]|uniref:Chemotaxis protein CheW n=1 Tax=Thalassotalea algicola TaxID=2716224 RepID=A0A7Y0LBH4_9GAMM|nr:chemotaxis protein CheW [Thalassotalea algicola]NMP31376.1 purine-binding chemotaxis protein CheW [Thalassotalea algicola]